MAKPRARLLVLNDPYSMRISSELAQEIGLNESIMLLQLEYLISISAHERDGKLWTRQSLTEMKSKYFGWWSIATISRVIKDLEKMELIHVGTYNRHGYDKTQWFALNEVGINKLHSVAIFQNEKSISQDDDIHFSNCKMDDRKMKNASDQIETTIPETTEETTREREKPTPRAPKQILLSRLTEECQVVEQAFGKKLNPAAADSIMDIGIIDMDKWRRNVKAYASIYQNIRVDALKDWYIADKAASNGKTPYTNGTGKMAAIAESEQKQQEAAFARYQSIDPATDAKRLTKEQLHEQMERGKEAYVRAKTNPRQS